MFEGNVDRVVRELGQQMYRPWNHREAVSVGNAQRDTIKARPWDMLLCDPLRADFDVLLPDPRASDVAMTPVIVKTHSRTMMRRVTVRDVTGRQIDKSASLELGGHVDAYMLFSDGKQWRILSEYRPRKWVGAYALNFADHADLAIANGANTIDGRAWTGVNIGNAASVAIVNGTGLVFTASATSHNYFDATRTSPLIRIPVLTGLLAFYGVVNHIIRVQMRVTLTNADANYEGAFLALADNSAPLTQNFKVKKYYNTSAVRIEAESTVSSVTATGGNNSTPTDDILSLTFEAPRSFGAGSGASDGSGYLNAENPWHSVIQTITTPVLDLNPDPYVEIGFQTVNTNASVVATVTNFQADYTEKWPFINP